MHKNQSHQHSYFWTIVPGKTQCGKTGATNEGFINLQQQLLLQGMILQRNWNKTPETFPLRPSNTLETLHPLLRHPCFTLRGPSWLWVALRPSASACVIFASLLWTASLSALSPAVPVSPPPQSLPVVDALLFLHPVTLPLKSISSTWESIFLEILNICRCVSKWSLTLLLYFSCWRINGWD